MKILLVGGNGTIGKAVFKALSKKHEVLVAGRNSGDFQVDIANPDSIEALYKNTGMLDAVVCTAGETKWAPFSQMGINEYFIGIKSKLMGQVNLVRLGVNVLNPGGSFTLTTGILAEEPVAMTTGAALANGGIHGFVKAAALELTNGHRINVVAPGLVEDSAVKYADYFPGHDAVPMQKVANGYLKSVEGKITGQIIRIYG